MIHPKNMSSLPVSLSHDIHIQVKVVSKQSCITQNRNFSQLTSIL